MGGIISVTGYLQDETRTDVDFLSMDEHDPKTCSGAFFSDIILGGVGTTSGK